MTDQDTRIAHQPLHSTLLDKLEPDYIAFHNEYMQYVPRDESKIWDSSARTTPSLPYGGSSLVPVGDTRDIDLGDFFVRLYVPKGEPSADGWPAFVWFHGGGWAIGGLDDSADFLTRGCRDTNCVVITVAYRLSPEQPFPAPIHDAVATIRWMYTQPLSSRLDLTKISLGGTSAGANIAIVLALKLADDPPSFLYPLTALILIVPVIDNTATLASEIEGGERSIWHENRNAPWLTPARMLWYRDMYLPHAADRSTWPASPNLAPEELLKKLPKTWIATAECDLLASEALAFAQKLEGLGVSVERYVVEGGTHSCLALNGVLGRGRRLMEEAVGVMKRASRNNSLCNRW